MICEFPPETKRHRNGYVGWWWSSGVSFINCAITWAWRWLTSIRGTLSAMAIALAKVVPTRREPMRPGPLVNAIAEISSFFMFACRMASLTTGMMFC